MSEQKEFEELYNQWLHPKHLYISSPELREEVIAFNAEKNRNRIDYESAKFVFGSLSKLLAEKDQKIKELEEANKVLEEIIKQSGLTKVKTGSEEKK